MNFEVRPLPAGLYFVATPIGNARDITLRALDILASADVIAAEDTRTARKLMEIHGVPLADRSLVAFHDHSKDGVIARLIDQIKDGKSVACVSEAGTPLIADPGFELGRAAANESLLVTAAPGASALLSALSIAAVPTDRFAFVGFLPSTSSARKTEIAKLKALDFTFVIYESPKRLLALLGDVIDVLGKDRKVTVCRELTKKFEEVQRGTAAEVAEHFKVQAPRGEIVVLIEKAIDDGVSDSELKAALTEALKSMRIKDASTAVAGAYGLPRKDVYQLALGLKDDLS